MHLYLATPCYGCAVSRQYVLGVLRLQAQCMRAGVGLSVDWLGNESLVTRGRNVLCQRFLMLGKATHLLFVDSDIEFDPSLVFRLLEGSAKKGPDAVLTCCYPKKSFDWPAAARRVAAGEPLQQAGVDWNINCAAPTSDADGFIEVTEAATGFMLIPRALVERMAAHYRDELLCRNDLPGIRNAVPTYVALFDTMICQRTRRYLSEDYAFCHRATAIGGRVFVDAAPTSPPLGHVGQVSACGNPSTRFKLVGV